MQSWEDHRLTFPRDSSSPLVDTETLKIHEQHSDILWIPDFEYQAWSIGTLERVALPCRSDHPYSEYRRGEAIREAFVSRNGTVKAEVLFGAQKACLGFDNVPNNMYGRPRLLY